MRKNHKNKKETDKKHEATEAKKNNIIKLKGAVEEKEKKKDKRKLSEHTAFKNMDKKNKKDRQAVYVKKFTLRYEEELHRLQIELLKMQQQVKKDAV